MHIPVDLFGAYFDDDDIEMYDRNRGLYVIVLYQRNDGSLAIGADRISPTVTSEINKELNEFWYTVNIESEWQFIEKMENLTNAMRQGPLKNEPVEHKANAINLLCDQAIEMVNDGTLYLF